MAKIIKELSANDIDELSTFPDLVRKAFETLSEYGVNRVRLWRLLKGRSATLDTCSDWMKEDITYLANLRREIYEASNDLVSNGVDSANLVKLIMSRTGPSHRPRIGDAIPRLAFSVKMFQADEFAASGRVVSDQEAIDGVLKQTAIREIKQDHPALSEDEAERKSQNRWNELKRTHRNKLKVALHRFKKWGRYRTPLLVLVPVIPRLWHLHTIPRRTKPRIGAETNMNAEQEAAVRSQVAAIEQARFIAIREVSGITGFSKSSILRKIKSAEFPRPVIQEGNVTRWDFAEVMRWRAEQFKKRDERTAQTSQPEVSA